MNKQPLQDDRFKIFPRSVKGKFRQLKYTILALAYLVYFFLPWLPWQRDVGPDQAVLFDLIARKFYIFGLLVHAKEIFWLAGILMLAALGLFFITTILGRVFCGYFCFQTLWTDVFVWIERLVQGERPARIRLDKQPWNKEKLFKIGLTKLLWMAFSFWTGLTFTLYWGKAPELVVAFFTTTAPAAMYITTLIITGLTFAMAGFAREMVCTHMCPYSRFQSAMFDKNTKIVAYDQKRGEAKQGRSKVTKVLRRQQARAEQGVGDCIDCGFCVQVCPTGIDIRNGLQVSCIHCALCIDACDQIMDKMEWPRGLIRYSSQVEDEGGKTRYVKLQSVGYGLALLVTAALLVLSISKKADIDTALRQVRQPLYVVLSDGSIQNSYELKVSNFTDQIIYPEITLKGFPEANLDLGRINDFHIEPQKTLRLYAKVNWLVSNHIDKTRTFVLHINSRDQGIKSRDINATFYTP